MARTSHVLLLLLAWQGACLGQHTPYSLQTAVDELHRREAAAKYPLNAAPPTLQRYMNGALLGASPQDQDYTDEDSDASGGGSAESRNRHRLNKILAKYLEREGYETDRGGLSLAPFGGYEFDDEDSNNDVYANRPEDSKRSSYFRERDNKYEKLPSSVFRERGADMPNGGSDRSELAVEFLREIEESQQLDREARYKEALRRLWEKYQQQENDLDDSLYNEQKHIVANAAPGYYVEPLMAKKRSYPVLPWLPYAARKKRRPMEKRAAKRSTTTAAAHFGKTDERVARELSELFGGTPVGDDDEKKKRRSTDDATDKMSTAAAATTTSITTTEASIVDGIEREGNATARASLTLHRDQRENVAAVVHRGHGGPGKRAAHHHRKRSERRGRDESPEEEEESEEHEENGGDDGDGDDDDDDDEHDDFDDEDDEQRKKKKKREVTPSDDDAQLESRPIANVRSKKSIQWSKYFGVDRKKKSTNEDDTTTSDRRDDIDTNTDTDTGTIIDTEPHRNIDPEKLNIMDRKLQSLEDLIIDETVKYTGAHEGITSMEDMRRLKDRVLSRLATAYSLEKMRRALENLRQSVDSENHLLRNIIEGDDEAVLENEKRLSVKKEKAQYEAHHHAAHVGGEKSKDTSANALMSVTGITSTLKGHDGQPYIEEDTRKKQKKRNGFSRFPEPANDFASVDDVPTPDRYESLNDAYLGNKNYMVGSNQCPIIESLADRCRSLDLLSGDIRQELLPICGVHQICYLCGTSQVVCDYQYLAEADAICRYNSDCQAAARSVLMILRGSPGPQLGPKQCLKNPCLYSAMREIGL